MAPTDQPQVDQRGGAPHPQRRKDPSQPRPPHQPLDCHANPQRARGPCGHAGPTAWPPTRRARRCPLCSPLRRRWQPAPQVRAASATTRSAAAWSARPTARKSACLATRRPQSACRHADREASAPRRLPRQRMPIAGDSADRRERRRCRRGGPLRGAPSSRGGHALRRPPGPGRAVRENSRRHNRPRSSVVPPAPGGQAPASLRRDAKGRPHHSPQTAAAG